MGYVRNVNVDPYISRYMSWVNTATISLGPLTVLSDVILLEKLKKKKFFFHMLRTYDLTRDLR